MSYHALLVLMRAADDPADYRALLRDRESRLDVPKSVANREVWVG